MTRPSMKAVALRSAAALILSGSLLGGCSAGDNSERSPEQTADDLRRLRCRLDTDCPVVDAPCTECADGTHACPSASCVRGRCAIEFPECERPYVPCAGKACGDGCTICDPSDPTCVETAVVKYCQLDGSCGATQPECGPVDPCATVRCAAGTHCESGLCVPDAPRVACGGIAAFRCPGAGQCIDDPTDSCDPNSGGADCGGVCLCAAEGLCVPGFHWDSSPNACSCVPDKRTSTKPCGGRTCGAKEYCCNASCGICAPVGGGCIQIACLDPIQ
jgi:hypothetical protein